MTPKTLHESELQRKLETYRLTIEEYLKICEALGREPKPIEWPLFSALWSEHCSYKSSKVHLKKLFTKAPHVLQGPGENAGVIDLGEGERVAFKMESHNHPSFIEPTQGAATGVGGILRDIFTMGARPIAAMDYLCFGEPKNRETPRLLHGVVKGIGGYGNCVGVPTVNGQTVFHEAYNDNNLVNAFAIGLFRPGEEVFYGRAEGVGNWIVYAGAATGRDGVHGAAMASESFDSDIEKKKPNVQIGDPFYEKLLIEACIEVMQRGLVVGIQDMGAAGLTSSTFEMAARAKTGLKIDLKQVPLREPGITPEEILLSESQERMVLIIKPDNYRAVEEVFNRWDLECHKIGEITAGDKVELYWGSELLTALSHLPLVESAPQYKRPFEKPPRAKNTHLEEFSWTGLDAQNLESELVKALASTAFSSRDWITHQYDQRVGAKTVFSCEDSVAGLRLPDSGRLLTLATGCRPYLMEWDIFTGSMDAVALPVLQMALKGARALAVTDCLNFGNPEKPEIMGQFVGALESLNQACQVFETPIISGNVSLYNETKGRSIIPTPATGVVGLGEKIEEDYFGPRGVLSSPLLDQNEEFEMILLGLKNAKFWMGEWAHSLKMKSYGENFDDWNSVRALQNRFIELSRGVSQKKIPSAARMVTRGGLIRAVLQTLSPWSGEQLQIDSTSYANFSGSGVFTELLAERFYCSLWIVGKSRIHEFNKLALEPSSPSGTDESQLKLEKLGDLRVQRGKSKLHDGVWKINSNLELNLEILLKAQKSGLRNLVEGYV